MRARVTKSIVFLLLFGLCGCSSSLNERRIEAAVGKAFEKLQAEGKLRSGATVKVKGVQEVPAQNEAKADLDLSNAVFEVADPLSGQWEVGPGGYGGQMRYSKKGIRIESATALLKRYTNGKWILESIDTHSYELGVIKVDLELN
ncbi:MAG TPA: hypothetical protein VF791_18665 [Pyrinomonadaceae bacterium]